MFLLHLITYSQWTFITSYHLQSMEISIRDFDVVTSLLQNFKLGTYVHKKWLKQYPTLIFCQVTLHPNDFTYPCWNGLIKSLNIVDGDTFPHTSNFGNKFVLGVDVSSDWL